MKDLTGRTAVVTGGAAGIGLGMTEEFLARGASVCIVDVSADALRSAEAHLDDARVLAVQADIAVAVDVSRMRHSALERFDSIDIVCANAGVGSRERPMWELPLAEWRWVMEINVLGVVATIQAFLPEMLKRDDGHVVITSSMQGVTTGRVGPYSASKAGSAAVAESLATDLVRAGSRIGVSCLLPSYTRNGTVDGADRSHRFEGVEYSEQDEQARAAVRAKLAEKGVPARLLGEMVADAVGTRRFWLVPEQRSLARVRQRAAEIIDGSAPAPATT